MRFRGDSVTSYVTQEVSSKVLTSIGVGRNPSLSCKGGVKKVIICPRIQHGKNRYGITMAPKGSIKLHMGVLGRQRAGGMAHQGPFSS